MLSTRQPGGRLSARFVGTVNRPGLYGNGRGGYGLSFVVRKRARGGVTKSWRQRMRSDGKMLSLGLGTYPEVSLSEALDKARKNVELAADGIDPRDNRRGITTFAVV